MRPRTHLVTGLAGVIFAFGVGLLTIPLAQGQVAPPSHCDGCPNPGAPSPMNCSAACPGVQQVPPNCSVCCTAGGACSMKDGEVQAAGAPVPPSKPKPPSRGKLRPAA